MIKAKREKVRRSTFDRVFDAVNVALLVIVILIILYPLYFTVIASISDPYELMGGNVILLPKGFTMEPYTNIFKNEEIWNTPKTARGAAGFATSPSETLPFPRPACRPPKSTDTTRNTCAPTSLSKTSA